MACLPHLHIINLAFFLKPEKIERRKSKQEAKEERVTAEQAQREDEGFSLELGFEERE